TDGLIQSIARMTGLEAVGLPNWLHLKPESAARQFRHQRAIVTSAQFLVTDIYHLSINALNCGVPVFCLGRPDGGQIGTLGDFKKKVLFSMLGLEDRYFEIMEDGAA